MMPNKKLKTSPIIEAVCEFRFDLENPNDPTLSGRLFSSLSDKYPIIKNRNLGTPSQIEGKAEAEILFTPLVQFYSSDERGIVQVGQNMLTVNRVKPYISWEDYKTMIMDVYNIYLDKNPIKGILKISLRIINKIHIPIPQSNESIVDLKDYFKFYPQRPENILGSLASFNIQVETQLNEKRDVLLMGNFTSFPDIDKEGNIAFVLDINYTMNKANSIEKNDVSNWLEEAHTQVYNAFNAAVTEELLNIYDN